MSYEGFLQCICPNGHFFNHPETYGNSDVLCDECGAKPAWINPVDQTNGHDVGFIPLDEFKAFENPDGTHRIPSIRETHQMRHYVASWKYDGKVFDVVWERIPLDEKAIAREEQEEADRLAQRNKRLQKLAKRK